MSTEPLRHGGTVGAGGALRQRVASLWPPLERREFWAIQALVLVVAGLHAGVEAFHMLGEDSLLYLVPTSLFLVPVVYAAVTFGLRGAAMTTMWAALLVMVNVAVWHEGVERAGELVQMAWIGMAGVFVGYRVDRERDARLRAETHEAALNTSQERYQDVVDNIAEPIVVVDSDDRVLQANRAASELLGNGDGFPVEGRPLPSVVSRAAAAPDDSVPRPGAEAPAISLGVPPRRYELVVTPAPDDGAGEHDRQILFRDITASYEREQGLEVVAREALAAREAEQQRIARELHDGPLQTVMQLWRDLDELERRAPDERQASVNDARETAESVAAELRRFSRDLRPSVLDDLGISAAIRAEAESLEGRAGLSVEVRVTGQSRRLEEDVELALLRITQEAVRNVERHANASTVAIELAFSAEQVELRIADDGRGLDGPITTSTLLANDRLGLIGLQERARLVGGVTRFEESPGGGLTVHVRVPVNEIPHR